MSSVHLPPLPPVGGGITGRSVLDVLSAQHRDLLSVCDRLDTDPRLVDVLVAELSRHLSAEEQYLYPAIRRAVPGGADLVARELAENHKLMLIMKNPDKSLGYAVRRHVAADTLAVLAQAAPSEDLVRLGNRVEIAGEAAPTRPHPGTPSAPPWNKIVDPVVAVADKLRDVVTRRTTHLGDL